MVEERANLDYGADDTTLEDERQSVEGDGFTMTDTADAGAGPTLGTEGDVDEVNEEADTHGAP